MLFSSRPSPFVTHTIAMAVGAIALFLLLRSCSGDSPVTVSVRERLLPGRIDTVIEQRWRERTVWRERPVARIETVRVGEHQQPLPPIAMPPFVARDTLQTERNDTIAVACLYPELRFQAEMRYAPDSIVTVHQTDTIERTITMMRVPHWSVGFHAGYGLAIAPNDNGTLTATPAPTVGVSLHYNILNF